MLACSASRRFLLTIVQNSTEVPLIKVDYWDVRKTLFPLAFTFSHPKVRNRWSLINQSINQSIQGPEAPV